MKIATIISLAGTVTASGIFTVHRQWVLATTFILLTAYTLLTSVVRIDEIPYIVIEALPIVALILAIYEVLRKVASK